MELCWLTCVSSRLNGEELARAGGVATLGALLSRCATVLPTDAAPNVPAAIIATHALRTFAGMAAFAHARSELLARCAAGAYFMAFLACSCAQFTVILRTSSQCRYLCNREFLQP